MTEHDSPTDDTPENSCFYYGACGNTVPANGLMCSPCLSKARHKDKLGREIVGDLMEFTELLYEEYEDEDAVMNALYEEGVDKVVYNVTN